MQRTWNPNALVTTWDLNLMVGGQVSLGFGGDVDVHVDWGDGTGVEHVTSEGVVFHTFGDGHGPSVDVSVTGRSTSFDAGSMYQRRGLVAVRQWGQLNLRSLAKAFADALHLTEVPASNDGLELVTDLSGTFMYAESFNAPLGGWDMSNVSDMSQMLKGAKLFDRPVGTWDVSNVTTFEEMFMFAESFNRPLANWDVSAATSMKSMFESAVTFNQPLSAWDVSAVTDMHSMFANAERFDQPLDSWDVSSVRTVGSMFSGASTFNQPLANWNVSQVEDFSWMFFSAFMYCQDLTSWDVEDKKRERNFCAGSFMPDAYVPKFRHEPNGTYDNLQERNAVARALRKNSPSLSVAQSQERASEILHGSA